MVIAVVSVVNFLTCSEKPVSRELALETTLRETGRNDKSRVEGLRVPYFCALPKGAPEIDFLKNR